MTTYAEAAALSAKTPVCLVTISLTYPSAATIRAATTAYTDATTGSYYPGNVVSAPTISSSISSPYGGQSTRSIGSIEIINTGALDDYVDYLWIGASVEVVFGFAEIEQSEYKTVFAGYVAGKSVTETEISLSLQSAAELLEQTTIAADEYTDMALSARVEWVLGLAGVTKDETVFAAWSATHAYTTRFWIASSMTAIAVLETLLFDSVWGVNATGQFYVYTAAEATGTPDCTISEADILSISTTSLSQYYKIDASIPEIEPDDMENLLPDVALYSSLSTTEIAMASASSWTSQTPTMSYTSATTNMLSVSFDVTDTPAAVFSDDGYWSSAAVDAVGYQSGYVDFGTQAPSDFAAGASLTGQLVLWVPDGETPSATTITGKCFIDYAWVVSTLQSLSSTDFTDTGIVSGGYRKFTARIYITIPASRDSRWPDIYYINTAVSIIGHLYEYPQYLYITLDATTTVDNVGMYAEDVNSIIVQAYSDESTSWVDVASSSSEETICTGEVAWHELDSATSSDQWRIKIVDADAGFKIHKLKFCDSTLYTDGISVELSTIQTTNPLAKASTGIETYIKNITDATTVIQSKMEMMATPRKTRTVDVASMSCEREMYEVVSLSTDRIPSDQYRVVGITENLADGVTTLELFK